MHYIRLVIACAAMLLSWLCFEGTDMPAQEPQLQKNAAETAEAVMEVVAEGKLFTPMAARSLEVLPFCLPTDGVGTGMDTDSAAEAASLMTADDTRDPACIACVMEQEDTAAAEQMAEPRRVEEERRRRAAEEAEKAREAEARRRREAQEAKEAEQRRIAAEKAAKEAALKAACPGYDAEFVATLTKEEQAEARYFYEQGFVFYRQNWSVLDDMEYGNEGFGLCGCGPTCIAAVISNLAGVPVDPEEMRVYGLSVGSWLPSGGTTYGFLIETAKKYGIKTTQIYASDKESLFAALRDENKLVLATMGPGDFTLGAHFMLFRGITKEGKILISDSYSYEHSIKEWDYEDLYAQLKTGYWIFEKEK